jgi:hypothetical protein
VSAEPSAEPPPRAGSEADGEARLRHAASEVGALVETQVRDAITGAERAAEEVRQRALGDASADRAAVEDMAGQVLARIGELEERVVRLFGDLRAEAQQIAEAVDSPGDLPDGIGTAAAGPGNADAEQAAATSDEDRSERIPGPGEAMAEELSGDAPTSEAPQPPALAEPEPGAEPALASSAEGLSWTSPVVTGPPDQEGESVPADPQSQQGPTAPERDAVSGPAASPADEEEGAAAETRDEDRDAVRPADAPEQQAEAPGSEARGSETRQDPMAWPAGERADPASDEGEHEPSTATRRRRGLFRHHRDG